MTDDELNKWAHGFLGECWHEWEWRFWRDHGLTPLKCKKCEYMPQDLDESKITEGLDYCSDKNLSDLLEAKIQQLPSYDDDYPDGYYGPFKDNYFSALR